MYKYFCGGSVILCFAFNAAAMNNSETNISDEHKKTARTMLQEAYRAHKEPSWPDLHEDDIEISVNNNRILASGIVDRSNCIVHNVWYPGIEVSIHRRRIEITEPYDIVRDQELKPWAIACIHGIADLCTTPVYAWRTLTSFCRRGSAETEEDHRSRKDPATSLDKLQNHLD